MKKLAVYLKKELFYFAMIFLLLAPGRLTYASTINWDVNKFISADYTVRDTDILIIKPGVKVELGPNIRIIVKGTLIAKGTGENLITFTCRDINNFWNCIEFRGPAPELEFCVFEKTKSRDNIDGALHFGSYSKCSAIRNCTFTDNKAGSIYIGMQGFTPELVFENLKINSSENFGIVVYGGRFNNLLFLNNSVNGKPLGSSLVGFTGIRLKDIVCSNEVLFKDNEVHNGDFVYSSPGFFNHPGGALLIELPQPADIAYTNLKNNTFSLNRSKNGAVTIKSSRVDADHLYVEDNEGGDGGCSIVSDFISISDSRFIRNLNINHPDAKIDGGGGLTMQTNSSMSQVSIVNCDFSENRIYRLNGGGLRLIGNDKGLEFVRINNCQFNSNVASIGNGGAVSLQSYFQIQNVEMKNNRFSGNYTQYGDLGGGGILLKDINEIKAFQLTNSENISGNYADKSGNGGFISANNVKKVTDFSYTGNKHAGISRAESETGKGGLLFLDIGAIGNLLFSGNQGNIAGIAGDAGGLLYTANLSSVDNISIIENGLIKSKALRGAGGAFFISPSRFNGLLVSKNEIDSTYAKKEGGFLFIDFQNGQNLTISQNNLRISSSDLDGGSFFLKNSNQPGTFGTLDFKNNTIASSESKSGKGGLFYLIYNTGQNIAVEDNTIVNSSAGVSGGSFYMEGSALLSGFFDFNRNSFTNSTTSGGDGGVLFFHGSLKNPTGPFQMNHNIVSGTVSAQSKGGFAYFEEAIQQSFEFVGNKISSAAAQENGGLICFAANTLSAGKLIVTNNEISKSTISASGSGGLIYGKGDVGIIEFNDNSIAKTSADRSGGGIYWINYRPVDGQPLSVYMSRNTIGESRSVTGSGGMVYLEADSVALLKMDQCVLGALKTEMSGGGLYLRTENGIGDLEMNYNEIRNGLALSGDGGFADILSPKVIRSLMMRENNFKGGEFFAYGNGGIINLQAPLLMKVSIVENKISGMLHSSNGGFLNMSGNMPRNVLTDQFSIMSNTVFGTALASENGGLICYSGKNDLSFTFSGNVFHKSVKAGNAGGLIYFRNAGGENASVTLSQNIFMPASADSLRAQTGGFIHYEGNFINPSFVFDRNRINKAKAGIAGGVINIKNEGTGMKQNLVSITNNRFENISAGSAGAVVSLSGYVEGAFLFQNDTLQNIAVKGITPASGGAVYFNNWNGRTLGRMTFDKNFGQNMVSENEGGSFLKFRGSIVEYVNVTGNRLNGMVSDRTGTFDFQIEEITNYLSSSNNFANIAGQNGALCYVTGNQGSFIRNFRMLTDTLTSAKATQDGGGLFFNTVTLNDVRLDKLQLNSISADGTGGFLSASGGIKIEFFKMTGSHVANCSAGINGGFAGLSGLLGYFDIDKNNFVNNQASGNGGIFFLTGSGGMNKELKVRSVFENSGQLLSGAGGGFFLRDWMKAGFSESLFQKLRSKGNGGGINAENIDFLDVGLSEFVFNESTEADGGAMSFHNIGHLTSLQNWFNSNLAHRGKGGSLFFSNGVITMKHDSVLYNEALSGAGLFLQICDGKIDSTYFVENKVADLINPESLGGAINIGNPKDTGLVISDCCLYRNTAFYGGGIYLKGSKVRFIRDILAFNTAKRSGAGCSLDESSGNAFYNCIFKSNQVMETFTSFANSVPVGGIFIYYGDNDNKTTIIENCVFHANYGLAVGISSNSSTKTTASCHLINSILYHNKYLSQTIYQYYPVNPSPWLKIEYCCIEDNNPEICPTCIRTNPNWELPESYCLMPVSPCIDKGNPLEIYNDLDKTRNNMGIMGGPRAFDSCESTNIKDDYCCVGNEELNAPVAMLLVYPNPATGSITLVPGMDYEGKIRIDILTTGGHVVNRSVHNLNMPSEKIKLDLRSLPKGIYMIRISNNQTSDMKKIILM